MAAQKRYDGQTLLVSGGLGDIALAIAAAFAREGARIALSDVLSASEAESRLGTLRALCATVDYARVDVGDAAAVDAWVQRVADLWGPVSIAVANAATVTIRNFQEITAAEWEREMRVNLNGSFYLAHAACRHFVAHGVKGNVVFLGSWAAHAVHAALPAYSVSKAAVRMLCRSMALEYAPHGIRINEVAPGYVNAGLSRTVWQQDPAAAEEARQKVPAGTLIEAEEVASQFLWICDPANRHVTGATLLMDGGLSLRR